MFGQDSTQSAFKRQIGPILNDLPDLDTLIVIEEDSTDKIVKKKYNYSKTQFYPINASGTFFRGLELSSQGPGMLNGGLRFQIAGKLNEKTSIAGIVTDESIPIQPDGTTASLEELDKIYLKVSHPSVELVAGDITISNNNGRYNTGNRNIVGITNNLNRSSYDIKTTYGQSKGKYNRIEMKGRDGHQGPYFLTSKDGMRNVIISAGSELVWLNGLQLERGQDRDYIIDYTSGELTFTPKNLIFFDSDIDIEYQYSESTYKSNYFETDINGSLNKDIKYNLTYVNEKDNINGSVLSKLQKKSFKSKDIIYQSGISPDSLGDYELVNNIYIYKPTAVPSKDRYTIIFSPDPNGLYVRKISTKDRIFYEYIGIQNNIESIDRFSPGRSIKAPEGHQLLQFNSSIDLKKGMSIITETAFSIKNNNLLSNNSDTLSNGNAFRIGLDQDLFELGRVNLGYKLEFWKNSKGFGSLGRDRNVNFNESWDVIDPKENIDEAMTSFTSQIQVGERIDSQIKLFQLMQNNHKRDRQMLNFIYRGEDIKSASISFNQVISEINFRELDAHISFQKGSINPFINYAHETREQGYRFDDILMGMNISKNSWLYSLGLGNRSDFMASKEDRKILEHTKSGKYFELDIKNIKSSGWQQEWIFRQRIQEDSRSQNKDSFNSLRALVNYKKRSSPYKLDFVLNAQNSLHESRTVVYDSVGIGFGHYRYDKSLNEYIRDQNGNYIAHTIFTGNYESGFRMDGLARFTIDFSKRKNKKLKNYLYRFINRLDFHGPIEGWAKQLEIHNVQLYQNFQRHEIIHRKKINSNRLRFWYENRTNFSGLDTRGWEKRGNTLVVGESQISINNSRHLILLAELRNSQVSSQEDRIVERNISGFTSEIGLKENRIGYFQWESRFIYYKDRVFYKELDSKNVNAYGLKTSWLHFIGKEGRIEGALEYYMANGFKDMPPEALNGVADNQTLKSNISASILLSRSLSLNGTIFYLDNKRYNNFFKIQAEIRAHF